MLNFQTDTDRARTNQAAEVQTVRAEVPMVQERVTAIPAVAPAPQEPAHDPKNDVDASGSYEWEHIRDYVIEQILAVHGPFPRDVRKENTVFMGFAARWEGLGLDIARYAFEQARGEWLGAPVSVARFHKTSDPVFAHKISSML